MKKAFQVSLPFAGSLAVEVMAEDEEQALAIGRAKIEFFTAQQVVDSAQFENYEVYEF